VGITGQFIVGKVGKISSSASTCLPKLGLFRTHGKSFPFFLLHNYLNIHGSILKADLYDNTQYINFLFTL